MTACQVLDAEFVGECDLDGDLVADRDQREREPNGRSPASARTVRSSLTAARTLGHTTKYCSVSMGAPGPMSAFHQPGETCPGPDRPGGVGVPRECVQDEHGVRPI